MKKCKINEPTIMSFPVLTGEEATLSFGYNTKFDFMEVGNDKVNLVKGKIYLTIKKSDFDKMFTVLN